MSEVIGKDAEVGPEVKALRSRRRYVQQRAPIVREEIKALTQKRQELAQNRKNVLPDDRQSLRQLNEQTTYLTHDLARLKSELKALATERGDILQRLKPFSPQAGSAADNDEEN